MVRGERRDRGGKKVEEKGEEESLRKEAQAGICKWGE